MVGSTLTLGRVASSAANPRRAKSTLPSRPARPASAWWPRFWQSRRTCSSRASSVIVTTTLEPSSSSSFSSYDHRIYQPLSVGVGTARHCHHHYPEWLAAAPHHPRRRGARRRRQRHRRDPRHMAAPSLACLRQSTSTPSEESKGHSLRRLVAQVAHRAAR